jgi:multicomponent K+:H+ antiporter subunit E
MRRLLPFPLLAATLFAMWVLLTDFSPGHILFAVVVALAVPRVMLVLQADRPRIRLGMAAARLAARVLADIVRSNIAVARLVLGRRRSRRSGFIRFPTRLRSPEALAALAIIVSATPGTIWVAHDSRRHVMLIHVLDLGDEDAWITLLRDRYETLLMEIFA